MELGSIELYIRKIMKNIFRILSIVLIAISFNGCLYQNIAIPNLIAGKYYLAGDDVCSRYRVISDTRIMCLDINGKEMGWRDAMTDQEISMYQHNQQMNAQAAQQQNYNTQQQINRSNYNTQQGWNRINTYKVRTVGPYGY